MAPPRLATHWHGAYLVDEGRILESRPFGTDDEAIAERLNRMRRGEVLEEERALAALAGRVEVGERRLLGLHNAVLDEARPWVPHPGPAADAGLLHRVALALARVRLKEASSEPDKHIVEAVNAMDDLIHVANLLSERLREWYALHAPELVRGVDDHERLARAVAATPERTEAAEALGIDLGASLGGDLGEREGRAVGTFASVVRDTFGAWRSLMSYIEGAMATTAPNLTGLVGPAIAARLVKQAGGLSRLASLPAGTIQTLGAEKALFRHIKEGNQPPKHGVIFQHNLVFKAPWWQRGRMARLLASRIAIAARADAFTGEQVFPALLADLERRAAKIDRAHPRPPQRGGRQHFSKRPPGRPGGGKRR